MWGKAISGFGQRPWPKMQLVYFLIAAFNLAVIFLGLHLNHLVVGLHQKNHAVEAEFDAQLSRSLLISNLATDAQAEYVKLRDTNALETASAMFNSKAQEFELQTASLRQKIQLNFDKESTQGAISLIDRMDATMAAMQNSAATISSETRAGNTSSVQAAISQLHSSYTSLRRDSLALIQLIGRVKADSAIRSELNISGLRKFEYVVSWVFVLATCCFAFYGLVIGWLLRRKFTELEKSNAKLAESHEQALVFSKEIQLVNNDMGVLNQQLNENISKLRIAQEEALRKGKMAQLGNLTATVAHELRNPLSTVRTSTYLLSRKLMDKGLGVEPQLQRINSGVIRCDNIITQLLDFSRSKPVKLEPIVLDVWLEKLVQMEAQKLPEIVSIECYFGLGERIVEIEPGRFERAIINLISNASEALVGKGDDPKSRYTETPVISISTKLTARGAEITVADNGPGISTENMLKIREPLFTTKNFGTGLGISAVEQILEQHSGGLDIKSVEGHGAGFTLWLPARSEIGEHAA